MIDSQSKLIDLQRLTEYDALIKQHIASGLATKAEEEALSAVNALVAALQQSGIAQGDNLSAVINEESVMEGLTDANTIENVLYLGLEPLEEDSATYNAEDGTLTMSNASYDAETGTLTTGATFDSTTGQLKFN